MSEWSLRRGKWAQVSSAATSSARLRLCRWKAPPGSAATSQLVWNTMNLYCTTTNPTLPTIEIVSMKSPTKARDLPSPLDYTKQLWYIYFSWEYSYQGQGSIFHSFLFSTSLAGSLKDRERLNNNLTGPPCRALSFNSPPGGGVHLVQIAVKLKMPGVDIVWGICRYLR